MTRLVGMIVVLAALLAALVGLAWLFYLAAVIVGFLLCCVGLLATLPAARAVTDFALTESYLLLTRGPEITGYWKLWELKAGGEI